MKHSTYEYLCSILTKKERKVLDYYTQNMNHRKITERQTDTAVNAGVSVATVQKTIIKLEEEGFIINRKINVVEFSKNFPKLKKNSFFCSV